jgi:hypothetical protein
MIPSSKELKTGLVGIKEAISVEKIGEKIYIKILMMELSEIIYEFEERLNTKNIPKINPC